MTELKDILREEYIKEINKLDLRSLLEMVEDVMSQPLTIVEDTVPTVDSVSDRDTLEMVMKMIPNIEVSEIGWSDVRTTDTGAAVSGPQRALLENYLNNIHGTTFQERIDYVGMFYAAGAGVIAQGEDQSPTGRITQAISYLVFYKTLTKVITNFNASSAGFSFESFLSALVKGQQIQTGNKTIADYTDNLTDQEIPVSLKLYREGSLEVGGSYTALVDDLIDPKFDFDGMRYVICTKELEGEDLEQEGEIKVWQFDFTLDNVMWIMMNSKDKSSRCIMIPQAVKSKIEAKGAESSDESYTNILKLPSKSVMPTADEIHTQLFIPKFRGQLEILKQNERRLLRFLFRSEGEIENFLNQLNWDSNDDLFNDYIVTIKHEEGEGDQEVNKGAIRGISTMNLERLRKFVINWRDSMVADLEDDPERNRALAKLLQTRTPRQRETLLNQLVLDVEKAVKNANQGKSKKSSVERKSRDYRPHTDADAGILSVYRSSEIDAERRALLQGLLEAPGGFLNPVESATFYSSQNERFKKIILEHTLGYLTTMHFSLNQTQATNGAAPGPDKIEAAPTEKNPRATKTVKGGTGADYLGEIKVGAKYVAEAMADVRDILNEEILEIFSSLKALSDNLNAFFAGGLKKNSLATLAVGNANNITSKKVLNPESATTQAGPAQRATRVYDAGGYGGAPTYEE